MHIPTLIALALVTPTLCAVKPKNTNGQQEVADAEEKITDLVGLNFTTAAGLLSTFPTCSQFCVGAYYDSKFASCGVANTDLYTNLKANKTSVADSDPSKIDWPCLCAAKEADGTFSKLKQKVESYEMAMSCAKAEDGILSEDKACLEVDAQANITVAYAKFKKWCDIKGYTKAAPEDTSSGIKIGGAVGMFSVLGALGSLFVML